MYNLEKLETETKKNKAETQHNMCWTPMYKFVNCLNYTIIILFFQITLVFDSEIIYDKLGFFYK
jgi:hypothetical protein